MGTQSASIPTSIPGIAFAGGVHGGQQPVTGSAVYLFAAGTTGYDSAAKSLLTPGDPGILTDTNGQGYVLTGSGGNFTISSDYTCPSSTRNVYLVSVGGNPGLSTPNTNNADLVLVAALGPCGNLTSSTYIAINEVSTIAAAYSLNGFASPNTSTTLSTGGTSTTTTIPSIAATITNSTGITNAFGTVPQLIDPAAGTAYNSVSASNTIKIVPQGVINSLADILAYCVNTDGTTGECDTLFAYAAPDTSHTPTNTFAAAIDIAQNPGHNASSLFNLISGTPPFTALPSTPTQWSLPVFFGLTEGALLNTYAIAVDAEGNIWCTAAGTSGDKNGTLKELLANGNWFWNIDNLDFPQHVTIDPSGRIWITLAGTRTATDKGGVLMFDPTNVLSDIYTTDIYSPLGIASDGSGSIWVTNLDALADDGSITVLNTNGTPIDQSPITSGGVNTPSSVAIDSNGLAWVTNFTNSVTKLNGNDSVIGDPFPGNSTFSSPYGLAIDASGNAWISNSGSNSITVLNSAGAYVANYTAGGLNIPASLSIDGAGNVFVPNQNTSSLTKLKNNGTAASGSPYAVSTGEEPVSSAVDGSGNVWVTLGNANAIAEFVGLGVPVVTPLVTGIQNGTLGTRP